MGTPRHSQMLEKARDGEHLAIWGLSELGAAEGALESKLSAILAERESRGSRVPVVTLLVRDRADAPWVERAVRWLGLRGRRVVVRTRVVLDREVVDALVVARDQAGAVVELELAHHKPAIQRALLGDRADPAAALLLQAQHLETLEIPVVARLAPLLPGIHDQPNGFATLVRNVVAADVCRVVVEAGKLHSEQLRRLVGVTGELTVAGCLELARAFSVDAMVLLSGADLPAEQRDAVFKLKPRRARVLEHGFAKLAADAGAQPMGDDASGYQGLVEAASSGVRRRREDADEVVRYEPVMGRDLFAGLELG